MRRTTRLRCQIPVSVVSLDPRRSGQLQGWAMVVNAHGCCVQVPSPLPPGTPVRMEVGERRATGRVVNTTPVDEQSCVLGIALEPGGNVWGIKDPPADWGPALAIAPEPAASTETKTAPAIADHSADESHREEISTQLSRLQKMHAEQLVILQEERASARAAREAAERAIGEQIERVRQVRQYVESLACSIPTAIKTQAQEQAKTLLQHLREMPPDSNSAGAAADEQKLNSQIMQLGQQLRRELREDLETRMASPYSEGVVRALEGALQDSARQLSAQLARQSEQAVAEVRAAAQRSIAEQQAAGPAGTLDAQTVASALRQETGSPAESIRQDLDDFLQQRRQQFEEVHQTAMEQLRSLETRAEALVSLVDLELQNHADQMVQDTIAQMRQDLPRESAALYEQRLGQMRADLSGGLDQALARADTVRADLQHLLQNLEQQTSGPPGPLDSTAPVAAQEQLVNELRPRIETLFAGLREKFDEAYQAAISRFQQQLREEAQKQSVALTGEQEQRLGRAIDEMRSRVVEDIRQQVETLFAGRQQEFHAAHDLAVTQLQRLQERADTVTSLVDVELQKRTDECMHEAVAQFRDQLQHDAAAVREEHAQLAGNANEELRARVVADARQQLEAQFAGREQEVRATQDAALAQLQQLENRANTLVSLVDVELQNHCAESLREATAELRQAAERQTAAELLRLQAVMQRVCADAGGEIRGRLGQALENATGTLDSRAAALHQGLAESACNHARALDERLQGIQRQLDGVWQELQARLEQTQAGADAALQARFGQIVETCSMQLEALARASVERWRAAIYHGMAAMEGAFAEAAGNARPADSGKNE